MLRFMLVSTEDSKTTVLQFVLFDCFMIHNVLLIAFNFGWVDCWKWWVDSNNPYFEFFKVWHLLVVNTSGK